jgi:hypothetical protein
VDSGDIERLRAAGYHFRVAELRDAAISSSLMDWSTLYNAFQNGRRDFNEGRKCPCDDCAAAPVTIGEEDAEQDIDERVRAEKMELTPPR